MSESQNHMNSAEPVHCTWADLSLSDTEKLLDVSCDDLEIQKLLVEKLGLLRFPTKQRLILLDLFTYTWLFGKKEGYKPDQMSTILTMVKRLHAKCTSTSRENLDDVLKNLQDMLVQHSVNRPPFSHSIFSLCQVKSITEFILSTYFKHYKLYKYAFTKKLHLNVNLTYAGEAEEMEEEQDAALPDEHTEDTSKFLSIIVQFSSATETDTGFHTGFFFLGVGAHTHVCLTTPTFTHLIKNCLRSRISDINLGRLMRIAIEGPQLTEVNFHQILDII